MKENIDRMLEAQQYWQNSAAAREKISRYEKSIKSWKKKIKDIENQIADREKKITSLKLKIKENETALMQIDEVKASLEGKRLQLTTEKELNALDNEIKNKTAQADEIENALLEFYDELSEHENNLAERLAEQDETLKDSQADIEDLNKRIEQEKNIISVNTENFENTTETIDASIRQRFLKLLESKNGKGISEVKGEICTGCNFQVPPSLAHDASHSSKIITCTNCGRYIFVRS